VYKETYGLLFC